MKIAVLICRSVTGELLCEAAESLVPILARAKEARYSGALDDAPITVGLVMASWRPGVIQTFRCKPVEVAAPEGTAPKPRKSKR